MPPVIAVQNLSKTYASGFEALRSVSLEVRRGEIFALLGPNGAGKTSTVETAEGYRRPAAGSVRVLDRDPEDPWLRERVGVMPQGAGAYPGLRVGEAVRLFASYYDEPDSPDRLLDLLLLTLLRTWFERPGSEPPAWYAAQGDPVVGPALRLMQHHPEHPWTVAGLADRAGVSRAAFARPVPRGRPGPLPEPFGRPGRRRPRISPR